MLAREMDTAFRRRALWVFEELEIAEGDRVLDCGCGRGFYLHYARCVHPAAWLVGIDAALGEIAAVEPRDGTADAGRVAASAGRLPFPDSCFDRVILSEVIEHLDDDLAALREVFRVVRPGGRVAVTVPNRRFPAAYDPVNAVLSGIGRPVRRGPLAGIWTDHRRLYDRDELVGRAVAVGFEVGPVATLTRSCLPFQHLLLYGVGKPLVRGGRLPRWVVEAVDRVPLEHRPARRTPIDLVRRVMAAIDRANRGPSADGRSVNLAVLLRKPGGGRR